MFEIVGIKIYTKMRVDFVRSVHYYIFCFNQNIMGRHFNPQFANLRKHTSTSMSHPNR